MKRKSKKRLKKKSTKIKDEVDKLSLKRYQDIENGKVLPTFIEFFKLCIIFDIAENVNLKWSYPSLYKDLKRKIDARKKEIDTLKVLKKKQ